MVSKRELQFRLDDSLSTVRTYEKALRKAAEHLNCPIGYFDAYSLGEFIKDLETVANEKTATEARKRLGLDKPGGPEMSKVEKGLREIADCSMPLPKVPEYYEDRGTKKDLDALTERVAYLEAFGLGPPIPERAVTHGVPQSYREGGFTKQPKPRYRLEAIPCTKPQEYTVVRIEEEK